MSDSQSFDLTPSPRLLQVLGEIPMDPWACIAELVDNSFDAFGGLSLAGGDWQPRVEIEMPTDGSPKLVIKDNGFGMDAEALEKSLKAGYSGKSSFGSFGLFGMGFNIASARLGTCTTVRTSRKGDGEWLEVTIDPSELQRKETFIVPYRTVAKEDPLASGTSITVDLQPALAAELSVKGNIRKIRNQLGNVYSYLLRTEIPSISDLP